MTAAEFHYKLYAMILAEFSVRQGTRAIYALTALIDGIIPHIEVVGPCLIIGGITFSDVEEMSKEDALLSLEVLAEDWNAAKLLPTYDNTKLASIRSKLCWARHQAPVDVVSLLDGEFLPLFQKFDEEKSFVYT